MINLFHTPLPGIPHIMSSYGEALFERREVLGYASAGAIADASYQLEQKEPDKFKAFSRSTMSRLENDKCGRLIEGANAKMIRTLAYLLKWSSSEFETHVGVPIGSVPYLDAVTPVGGVSGSQADSPHLRVREGPTVRLLGVVSAGTATGSMVEDLGRVNVPDAIADRFRLGEIFALEVAGDSMTCEDAHKNIPEGSTAFFHSKLRPEMGDIIVCRITDPEISILKVYRPGEDYVVLESYNQQHKPIVLTGENECRLEGVYLTHIPRPRRLR